MRDRSTQPGQQLELLPLEKFLAGEAASRAPGREPRQIGSIVADIVDGLGRPHAEGEETAKPALIRDREGPPRMETGKNAEPEGPASYQEYVSQRGGTYLAQNSEDIIAPALHRLRRRMNANAECIVVAFICPGREDHHASSETWIEF